MLHTGYTQYQSWILPPVGQEGGAAQVEVQDPYQNEPERHPALIVRSAKPFNAETPRVSQALQCRDALAERSQPDRLYHSWPPNSLVVQSSGPSSQASRRDSEWF